MTEFLYLLLPLVFYSGWQAARRRYKNRDLKLQREKKKPENFVKGVNFLLNEQPDKALQFFLNYPDIDDVTAETFLLLGNLFRNRGEIERALSVHQNLLARANLKRPQRTAAMLALGEDFFAAGMLDRAESVFKEIVQNNPKNADACLPLRNIYEQLKEWEKAIKAAECTKSDTADQKTLVAHYYCEMAEEEMEKGNLHIVEQHLKSALKKNKESSRVVLLEGDVASRKNNHAKALKKYKEAIEIDTRLLGVLFPKLVEISQFVGGIENLNKYLLQHYKKTGDFHVFEYLLEISKQHGGLSEELRQLLEEEMANKRVSVKSIHTGAQLLLKIPQEGRSESDLQLIEQSLGNYIAGSPDFQCQHCGYKMHDYLWRCPACHDWDSVNRS